VALKIKFVINPAAGNGNMLRRWDGLQTRLQSKLSNMHDVEFTGAPHEATAITRRALHDGFEIVVAVGGDGTIHEVLNGFFENGHLINPHACLGVIAMGTGCDLVRTLNPTCDLTQLADKFENMKARTYDVGKLTCQNLEGRKTVRYFINIADAGFGARVAHRVNASSKRLGYFVSYLSGLLRTLREYENKPVTIEVDEDAAWQQTVNSVIVANGRYFGGGMLVAPAAQPDDGVFEIVVVGDISGTEAVRNLRRLYTGRLGDHPKVTVLRGSRITLASEQEVFIEADGELPGRLPAIFEILPGAIKVIA